MTQEIRLDDFKVNTEDIENEASEDTLDNDNTI